VLLDNRDSARKGKAVEHLVAATCILASGFELNVSTSLIDDEGVDLVFHRREHSRTLAVQVKSRSTDGSQLQRRGRFVATVRRSTFRPRADLHMLFVVIDTAQGLFGPVWLVPSDELASRARVDSRDRYRFVASIKPGTRDQWRPYRHSRAELPGRILEILATL